MKTNKKKSNFKRTYQFSHTRFGYGERGDKYTLLEANCKGFFNSSCSEYSKIMTRIEGVNYVFKDEFGDEECIEIPYSVCRRMGLPQILRAVFEPVGRRAR